MRKECSVADCGQPIYVIKMGLCRTHYLRLRKHGDVQADTPRRVFSETGVCKVDGCDRQVRAHGACGPHAERIRKYGDPTHSPIRTDSPAVIICAVPECSRLTRTFSDDLCEGHHRRLHARGDVQADKPFNYRTDPPSDGHKWCAQCQRELPVQEFGPKSNQADGRNRWCYLCVWRRNIRKTYNITPEQYELMLQAQHGLCRICGRPEVMTDSRGNVRRLCVDHDHSCCQGERSCGQCVRGLLCNICNRVLGMMADDPKRLLAMVGYLDNHQHLLETTSERINGDVPHQDFC